MHRVTTIGNPPHNDAVLLLFQISGRRSGHFDDEVFAAPYQVLPP